MHSYFCVLGFYGIICAACTCCGGPSVLLSNLCLMRSKIIYFHITCRIGVSMVEWVILIIWPLLIDQDRYDFLYSSDYGLNIFIVSIICFLIYTQYLSLFPNFALPHGIPIRSMYGYAFNGELEDLQRYKIPKQSSSKMFSWNNDDPQQSTFPTKIIYGDDGR